MSSKKALIIILFFLIGSDVEALKLKKVLILSRHNIRAPLVVQLSDYSPKKWPKWTEQPGHLTQKGEKMESYMGEYFSEWFKDNDFITDCPNPNSTIVHANVRQRTVQTAKKFAKSAFFNCNVKVYYKSGIKIDPIFNPVIRNSSEVFEEMAVKAMNSKLEEFNLTEQYKMLNDILDLNNSKVCKQDSFCDLTEEEDGATSQFNEEPNVAGPLFVANKVVDTFIMQYYNNTPFEHIAWGAIKEDSFANLTKVAEANILVRFKTEYISEHVAKPMLKYMAELLTNNDNKLAVLFGHDSNLNSVLSALNFKPYELPDQFEVTPIGGKIVFQKWYNETDDDDLLKIEYIYPSKEQLRNGVRLSWDQPPKSAVLEMKNCEINEEGFCSWNDFQSIIEKHL